MSDLLERLKAGISNKKTIMWPGTDISVTVRVLNEQDQLDATLATDKIFQLAGSKVERENIEAYEAEKNDQLLFRAIRDPEDDTPVASSITAFRQLLSEGIRKVLLDEVYTFQEENSPSPYNMDSEAYDAVLQAVKKNAERTVTNLSSVLLARRLIISLAGQLASLQTASGSTSSQ